MYWRKTEAWKTEQKRLEDERLALAKAEQRGKVRAIQDYEEKTHGQFQEDLKKARDDFKNAADLQIQISDAMMRLSGKTIAQLAKQYPNAIDALKMSSMHVPRYTRGAVELHRSALDTYQRIYAIEELLEALNNAS